MKKINSKKMIVSLSFSYPTLFSLLDLNKSYPKIHTVIEKEK